jgi:hypothetical protein
MSDDIENEKEIKTDYDYSRKVYQDLVEKGREGIEELSEIAKQLQHPRAYEVLAKLIKDTADVADKLMDVNKKNADIRNLNRPRQLESPGGPTNVFIGSTAELQRLMHQEMEKDITPSPDSNGN